MSHNLNEVLAKLREQNDANAKTLAGLNVQPTVVPAPQFDAFVTLLDEQNHEPNPKLDALLDRPSPFEGEHDFAAYDSSDIHLRTQEWERQAREVQFIEFHAPKKLPITEAQRIAANERLTRECPGVQLGSKLSQAKAHEILASYIGLSEASKIMADA